ncbi:hypothetical protein [Burkholderia pyrrocinia]|uniref:hypothetical protein n=1 Tax=Burkholderia pyrrocinia TaxID=60550 RepID=UPI001588631A|nr:hypothetical protein [Burkholderia pyrrocinia]
MCYSAKIQADYREYVRLHGADIDIETFRELYFERAAGGTVKIPKAVDVALLAAPASREIQLRVVRHDQLLERLPLIIGEAPGFAPLRTPDAVVERYLRTSAAVQRGGSAVSQEEREVQHVQQRDDRLDVAAVIA